MEFGLKITIQSITKTEKCYGDICLKDLVDSYGPEKTAADMLGVELNYIEKVTVLGNCKDCSHHKYLTPERSV